jgi:hypothetical protein
VFSNKNQRHARRNFRNSVVKRSTGIFTDSEWEEFTEFQRNRARHVKAFMKEVTPNVFNRGKGLGITT